MRVYKHSKCSLSLYVPDAEGIIINNILLYTNNINIAFSIDNDFTINGNILTVVVPENALSNMDDGVINYKIEGENYIVERQSNYFLKSSFYNGGSKEYKLIEITEEFVDEGYGKMDLFASDFNADGFSKVTVDASIFAFNQYRFGYENGIAEQKNNLESITINENGIYTNENGYNEVIVEVEGGGINPDIASQVLKVETNGTYYTKYSNIETGDNGFKSCATLIDAVFDTGIKPNENTKVEIWYNNTSSTDYNQEAFVFGTQNPTYKMMWTIDNDGKWVAEINFSQFQFEFNYKGWHHIIFSYADGLIIDDEKVGDFYTNLSGEIDETIYINGSPATTDYFANGQYGMIKITKDGETTIITPTADGFLNTNTNEYLTQVEEGQYVFIEEIEYGQGELIKTVIVNIPDENGSYDVGYDEGYRMGFEEGENYIKDKIWQTSITENGTYDLNPKEYFYMDDDKFELWETTTENPCCKLVYKSSSPGCAMINGDNNYHISNTGTDTISVNWGGYSGSYRIKNVNGEDWNTIEICGNKLLFNGAEYELTYNGNNTLGQLYLGDDNPDGSYPNGGNFNFVSFSYWNTQEAYLSKGKPDYFCNPGFYNELYIETKDGVGYYHTNLNEYSGVGVEVEEPSNYGWNVINVDVKPKLPNGVKFMDANILGKFPDDYDFSNVKDFSQMFSTITGMTSIPQIVTDKATTMAGMFEYCRFLNEVPLMNTENVVNMKGMFKECDKLVTIPEFNTSNCTNFDEMFWGCESLKTISQIDTSKATSLYNTFFGCTSLTDLPVLDCTSITNTNNMTSGLDNLVNFGGFLNLKQSADISNLKYLTYTSCLNILNGLATVSVSKKLTVSQEFYNTAMGIFYIAENKNWTIEVK